MYPSIDKKLCIICGNCHTRCPSGVLVEGVSGIEVNDPDGCYECGLCMELCNENAIMLVE